MPLVQDIPLADPQSIDSHLRNIKNRFLPNNSWLGQNNRYSKDTINRITIDHSANKVRSRQLSEYISASAILHCFDGWSHFSRGIESLISGDIGSAIHMIYYAELRATMSFLAREGIGAFNRQHFIVNSPRSVLNIGGLNRRSGTHDFVPDAIVAWAREGKNSQTLFSSIRVRGISFSEWFAAAGKVSGSPPSTRLAEEWLKNWSLDLRYISGDHVLRNEMSYRPHELSFDYTQKIFPDAITEIIGVWKACEPSGSEKSSDRFSILDYHLLRIALEALYKSMGKRLKAGKMSAKFLEGTFKNLGLPISDSFFKFLLREIAADDLNIFEYANHITLKQSVGLGPHPTYNRIKPFYSFDDALAIMARTLLLLRFSTAMASTLFDKTNITRNDIQFWLDKMGEAFGIWDSATKPTDLVELWDGVRASIVSIEAELAKGTCTSLAIANENPIINDLAKIKQFQRACLWGLGI